MSNNALVFLIDSVLGKGKSTSRGNRAYHCPECKHHKLKLEINLEETSPHFQSYQCWVCGFKGKKLTTLFKKIEVDKSKINQLRLLVKTDAEKIEIIDDKKAILPKEFIPLTNAQLNSLTAKKAVSYLKNRGITKEDIIKYNIGYCEFGLFSNMIIIPSYDAKGKLNYFTGRSFEKSSFVKYRNPETSRDIIPFELFINWDLPLVLCEGPFDAIAIKRNAIPLLGKNIQSNLMKKIVTSTVKKIYIALDSDALKQALKFAENFMNEGKEVYLVKLKGKDPSEMGFSNFTNLIQNTFPLTQYELLEAKLSVI